jgi:hypothetical protein
VSGKLKAIPKFCPFNRASDPLASKFDSAASALRLLFL